MLMKNPKVEFCGYSVPHPSENVINVRIQMYDNLSSLDALIDALGNLDNLCETVEDAYLEDLRKESHEKWVEKS
ncbi:DNA-directed RNA polymerases I and III subunit RPAC2 [Leucoagaricus sp. SymC.cos]|nr:DNA-directed RNA polymerases I and III subunit RPAC2 [Leucoagaricus sp. SymC.cos]